MLNAKKLLEPKSVVLTAIMKWQLMFGAVSSVVTDCAVNA
jgi:hypothetical protein